MSLDKGAEARQVGLMYQAEELRLYIEGNRDLVTDFKQRWLHPQDDIF